MLLFLEAFHVDQLERAHGVEDFRVFRPKLFLGAGDGDDNDVDIITPEAGIEDVIRTLLCFQAHPCEQGLLQGRAGFHNHGRPFLFRRQELQDEVFRALLGALFDADEGLDTHPRGVRTF